MTRRRRRYQRFLRRLGPLVLIHGTEQIARARARYERLLVTSGIVLALVVTHLFAAGGRRPGFAPDLTAVAAWRRRGTLLRRTERIIRRRRRVGLAALALSLSLTGAAHADGFGGLLAGLTAADLERLLLAAATAEQQTAAEEAPAAAEDSAEPAESAGAAADGKSLAAVVVASIDGDFDQGVAYPILRVKSPRDPRYHWHVDALVLTESVGMGAARELFVSGRERLSLGVAATVPLSASNVQEGATVALYGRLTIGGGG